MTNTTRIIIIVVIFTLLVGGGYLAYTRLIKPGPTTPDNTNAINSGQLPDSRSITDADRQELGIAEGIKGTITYSYDSDGNIIPTVTVTEDSRALDSDFDGLTDPEEDQHRTYPNNPDSDGDGWLDGDEVKNNSDPTRPDTDNDGLKDIDEYSLYFTDVLKNDTDGDGFSDGQEVEQGFNPLGPGTKEDTSPDNSAQTGDPTQNEFFFPGSEEELVLP